MKALGESCAACTGATSAPVIRRHYLFTMDKLLARDDSIRDSSSSDARGNNSPEIPERRTIRSSLVNTRAHRCASPRAERYAWSAWKRDFSADSARTEWCQFEQESAIQVSSRSSFESDQRRSSRLANRSAIQSRIFMREYRAITRDHEYRKIAANGRNVFSRSRRNYAVGRLRGYLIREKD